MNLSCANCNLNYDMEKIKDRLEYAIVKKNTSLLDDDVVNLSQLLDNFIYKCTFCNKNINCLSKLTSKKNSNFQFLEDNHFLISLYFYIFQGIKNNQMIYVSMDESLYKDLLNTLKFNSFSTEYIKFRSIKEVIISHHNGGVTELEEKIKGLSLEGDVKKYKGFRWISQPTYAIKNTSLKDFYNWEMNLGEALINTNTDSSLGFVYKKYNYMNEDKYINEPIIDTSISINSYVLDDLLFKGVDYKF